MANPFFKNVGPIDIKDIYKVLEIKIYSKTKKIKIFDIADLNSASGKDITFLHSNKYNSQASITNTIQGNFSPLYVVYSSVGVATVKTGCL